MSAADTAASRFGEGFNCAQSVLSAYAEQLGLDTDTALKLAASYGAGIARMAETCGAVTGALMVVGLKHGFTTAADAEGRESVYRKAREFTARFTERNGSLVCRELLGCDISTLEGMQQARDQQLFRTTCPRLVRDAAEILGEMG